MIDLPEGQDPLVNILAIDPGTNSMGLCFMTINILTLEIIKTSAETITVKAKLLNNDTCEYYSERQAKLDYLTGKVMNVIHTFKPITVVSEGPFYNSRRPAAFAPLLELLQQIKLSLREINNLIKFIIYPPSIVKQSVGAKGNADKDEMKKRVLLLKETIKYDSKILIDNLDEHSIDSIAVALTHIKSLKDGMLCIKNL